MNNYKQNKFAQRARFRSTLTDEERLYLLIISSARNLGYNKLNIKRYKEKIEEIELWQAYMMTLKHTNQK